MAGTQNTAAPAIGHMDGSMIITNHFTRTLEQRGGCRGGEWCAGGGIWGGGGGGHEQWRRSHQAPRAGEGKGPTICCAVGEAVCIQRLGCIDRQVGWMSVQFRMVLVPRWVVPVSWLVNLCGWGSTGHLPSNLALTMKAPSFCLEQCLTIFWHRSWPWRGCGEFFWPISHYLAQRLPEFTNCRTTMQHIGI